MWGSIAGFILKFRLWLLALLAVACVFAAVEASKVELSYEYTRAIPTDNPKWLAYQHFREKFGDDGNLLVMGLQTGKLFSKDFFNDYIRLNKELKKYPVWNRCSAYLMPYCSLKKTVQS
jgi:predicted RND superfamily exporter protein